MTRNSIVLVGLLCVHSPCGLCSALTTAARRRQDEAQERPFKLRALDT